MRSARLLAYVMAVGAAGVAQTRLPARPPAKAAAMSPWDAAVVARNHFEADGEHSKAGYVAAEDRFRGIYHANPADAHAAKAAEQVAELLAEQGRELHDSKAMRDAAGQYEWLAKAYPGAPRGPESLGKAVALLGREGLKDQAEAERVARLLETSYPKSAEAKSVRAELNAGSVAASHSSSSHSSSIVATAHALPPAAVIPIPAPDVEIPVAVRSSAPTVAKAGLMNAAGPADAASGVRVTSIRHWSTPDYTRVVIDLSDEVDFKAVRVSAPDRIFFDLHGARLAQGLAGKSFAVTDGGVFLSTIHAAQTGPDVARVVLDVKSAAEYSAFLLPNPERLIIDVHGTLDGAGQRHQQELAAVQQPGDADVAAVPIAPVKTAAVSRASSQPPAPVVRAPAGTLGEVASGAPAVKAPDRMLAPAPTASSSSKAAVAAPAGASSVSAVAGGAGVSTLPPMPVTDGSAAFGLPPKGSSAAAASPRVVVPSKATTAKPVPNTVEQANPETVSAVGRQPGRVDATAAPGRKPVVETAPDWTKTDHYVPRSARGGGASGTSVASPSPSTTQSSHVPESGQPPQRAGALAGNPGHGAPSAMAGPEPDAPNSLMRALGLKIGRIVIDAGHGGHDSGTLGAGGIEEKDVVLDVALRLGRMLHERLGAEIVYTRSDDTFIPLETRTAIANKAQADLFISVHANSSPDSSARGVEVYYLNFTSDPEATEVASRENAVSAQRVNQLSNLVKKIALKDKIDESRELATEVDAALYSGLAKGNDGLRDRGVKKAPFVVLIGANMPSILAEISFVTNAKDAEQLETPAYRERVAESLYAGVARYAGEINRRPAVKTERAAR